MADLKMPAETVAWMEYRVWGPHHHQWHFERRWDWYQARAARGDAGFPEAVADAASRGYKKANTQEGQPGNGEDFLFMHRAMLQLLAANFPGVFHFLRGWATPPQDGQDVDDPVPADPPAPTPNLAKGPFHPKMSEAIKRIEARDREFATEDEFGLFIQTFMRPVRGDPFARSADEATGIHNYLHNRFSDGDSPINLGDPNVNIFNERFWRLHGWIDHQWWLFRRHKALDDNDPAYAAKLKRYRDMMDGGGHHHMAEAALQAIPATRNFFADDFPR